MTVVIGALDVPRRVDEALEVEAAALGRAVESFRRAAYLRHADQPGYTAFGAYDGERLVGLAYGHVNAPGQWWYEQIAAQMQDNGLQEWLDESFVLVEIHVLPAHQGNGYGRTLLSRLLQDRRERRVMLSTETRDTPAHQWYRRLGFVDLLPDFRFATTEVPFAIMGAPLPLPLGGPRVSGVTPV